MGSKQGPARDIASAQRRLIFLSGPISDNPNQARHQRATLLARNFAAAIIYKGRIPQAVRANFLEAYRAPGRALAHVTTLAIMTYLRFFRRYRVVYTTYSIYSIFMGFLAKRFLGCLWICDFWDHPSLQYSLKHSKHKKLKRYFFENHLSKTLVHADLWIVAMDEGILSHLPEREPNRRILKVTNGVDCDTVSSLLADHHGSVEDEDKEFLDLCHSGWMNLERGLIQIIQLLQSLGPDHPLRLFVFGESDEYAKRAMEEHNRRGLIQIQHLGQLDHPQCLRQIAECDVALCLLDTNVVNYRYAYPIKLFEYLALGKITIATKTPAITKIIEDGKNGFLVDDSAESLRDTLDRILLMRRNGSLDSVKQQARETVENYRWEAINDTILAELDSLLSDDTTQVKERESVSNARTQRHFR
jgi:glycosyltransferase involved in cell wall biosynthesis